MCVNLDYDHFTSDFDYVPEDLSDDYMFDYEYGLNDTVHVCMSPFALKKLNLSNTVYRWFDKEFAHPDVHYAASWYDPIHRHCNREGYRRVVKHINGILKKCVGRNVSVALWKIKNSQEYKSSATFRKHAGLVIEALLGKENVYSDMLGDLDLCIDKNFIKKLN